MLSEEERQRLLEAVARYESDWDQIALHVGNGRSRDGCRHRWHGHESPQVWGDWREPPPAACPSSPRTWAG